MVAGAALAAIGGLAGLWLVDAAQERTAVLAVTRTVEVGTAITAADLAEVDVAVPPGVAAVPAGQRDTLVGKVARTDLHAGSLLAPGTIGEPVPPAPGQSLVVLALPPSRIPASGLHPGEHLVLVATADAAPSDSTPASPGAARPSPSVMTADAVVVRVGTADPNGTTQVDVAVHLGDGPLWAGLAASGRVCLFVVPQGQVTAPEQRNGHATGGRRPSSNPWIRKAPGPAATERVPLRAEACPGPELPPHRPPQRTDPDARRRPGAAVDHPTVRRLRRDVVDALAAHLRVEPGLDAAARRELGRALVAEAVHRAARDRIAAGHQSWTHGEEHALAEAVMAELFGLGRLQALVDDPDVENVEVNGCDRVWVSYADGREVPGPPVADSDAELIEQLQLLATRLEASERSFTSTTPTLHAPLEDGSRLTAMAWTTPRPHVVIRRHRIRDIDLDDLVRLGTLDHALAAFLRSALRAGLNIVVSGLQNAGKTTLVRALANEFGPMERFGTIEREYELFLHELPDRHPRVVPMQAREGSTERDVTGRRAGEVTMSDLVRDALRMTLRRIVVGEVRDSDVVLPMLEAMVTGDGSLCTLHARSAAKAIDRLVTLCLASGIGMTDTFGYRLIADAVDLIVHLELSDHVNDDATDGRRHRYVSEVLELDGIGEGSRPVTTRVFAPGPDGRAVPAHTLSRLDDLVRAGFDPTHLAVGHPGIWTEGGRR